MLAPPPIFMCNDDIAPWPPVVPLEPGKNRKSSLDVRLCPLLMPSMSGDNAQLFCFVSSPFAAANTSQSTMLSASSQHIGYHAP